MTRKERRKKSYADTPGTPAGSMTAVQRNREETRRSCGKSFHDDGGIRNLMRRMQPDGSFIKHARRSLKVGTWNVRGLYKSGKFENLLLEAEKLNTDILGISETHWTDEGVIKKEGFSFIHSGGTTHQHGVGILIKNSLERHIMGYWPVSQRNILLKINAKPFNLAIIQTYAPTTSYEDEEVEEYYEEVEKCLKQVKSNEILLILGDFNAKVGKEKFKDIAGQHGLGKRNKRGERLLNFCEEKKLIITNTFFQHHERRTYTYKSPGDVDRHQIDYILLSSRFRNGVKNYRAYPGADVASDHNPVIAKVEVKLKKLEKKKTNKIKPIDWGKLNNTKEEFLIEVKNKYEVLANESLEQQEEKTTGERIEAKWKILKESTLAALENAPKREKKANKEWMTEKILE